MIEEINTDKVIGDQDYVKTIHCMDIMFDIYRRDTYIEIRWKDLLNGEDRVLFYNDIKMESSLNTRDANDILETEIKNLAEKEYHGNIITEKSDVYGIDYIEQISTKLSDDHKCQLLKLYEDTLDKYQNAYDVRHDERLLKVIAKIQRSIDNL